MITFKGKNSLFSNLKSKNLIMDLQCGPEGTIKVGGMKIVAAPTLYGINNFV